MPFNAEILKDFLSPVFVETGSHTGNGIQSALDAGFKKVVSIELSDKWHERCCERFPHAKPDAENIIMLPAFPNVFLLHGDSGLLLGDAVHLFSDSEQCTFWLDGHFSGGDTAKGPEETPLIRELHHIARAERNDHIILIDDMRCWGRISHGFDSTDLLNILKVINPKYKIEFIDGVNPAGGFFGDDILVARL